MNIKELIKEASVRFGMPRRQALTGDFEQNAYNLLKGIVTKYNNDNLLSWTQNSIIVPMNKLIHLYDEVDTLKGDNNLYFANADELNAYVLSEDDYNNDVWAILADHPNVIYHVMPVGTPEGTVYTWYGVPTKEPYPQRYQQILLYQQMIHSLVRDVAKINSIYIISNTNTPYKEHYELEFVPHTEFDKYSNSSRIFTYTPKAEGEWLIQIKPNICNSYHRLKINYNESIEFKEGINTDLYIPDNYIELLIVALAHKLSIMYPRLDEAQMNRLEREVQVLVDNVRTPRSADRILTRDDYFYGDYTMNQYDLMSGRGMF